MPDFFTEPEARETAVPFARCMGEQFTHIPEDLYIPPDALRLFLESFEGPFDLLLYLIRRQKLDLNAVSVAAVTNQYMAYVEEIRQHNMELAADYLVMASDLMLIKSRMLLPVHAPESEEDLEDPTARILREVAEYEKIQVASRLLSALPVSGKDFWVGHAGTESWQEELPEVLSEDLARVWMGVLKNAGLHVSHTVSRQELSIHAFMGGILKGLGAGEPMRFTRFLDSQPDLQSKIVGFLAVLELVREGLVLAVQDTPYGEIYLSLPAAS